MRLNFTIFLLLFTVCLWSQAPVNDDCDGAIPLAFPMDCSTGGIYTNVNATQTEVIGGDPDENVNASNNQACFLGGVPDNDVWFVLDLPSDFEDNQPLEITISPETGGDNGPMSQPQVAIYRGACISNLTYGLVVDCAAAALGENTVTLLTQSLSGGNQYFIRVEDWSSSASSNAGDFSICIKAPDPVFNMGESDGSTLCQGILYDSGGPDNTYSNNENNTFTICPAGNPDCIELSVDYNIETNWDNLYIYEGEGIGSSPIFQLTGESSIGSYNVSSSCVTVQFDSDGSVTNPGFELAWNCTPASCENEFSSCADPTVIATLPYQSGDLTTCGAFNNETNGPCNFGSLGGEDYIFTYESAGNQCVSIEAVGAAFGTSLTVYNNCPSIATECIGNGVEQTNGDVAIVQAYFEDPGVYYIVVDNSTECTDFELVVDTLTCNFSSCADPDVIATLPFTSDSLTTCGAFNNETANSCGFNLLEGEDYIFTYTSPGEECISLNASGVLTGTTLTVYEACPSESSNCLGIGGLQENGDIGIPVVQLVDAGVYYIVVDNPTTCTDFVLDIENITCPDILDAAADCEDALNINGCSTEGDPQIINVAQEISTDPNVFQPGVNDGCWGSIGQGLFTWLTFQAQEDGNFGFLVSNAIDPNSSDIDIQVWGPYSDDSLRCDYMANNQPVRSTYDAPSSPNITGLIDINPNTGEEVTDICETASGDGFIRTIPVQEGEWYLILINDFSGTIGSGGINLSFGPTTEGGLRPLPGSISVSNDTVICQGNNAQLLASGGELYHWLNPEDGLSCDECADPVATVTEPTTFEVEIVTACTRDTLSVNVDILDADAGPDRTACLGEELVIEAYPNYEVLDYTWSGDTTALSCVNCPNPTVYTDSLGEGTHTYILDVIGETCTSQDTLLIEVLSQPAPRYTILTDTFFCEPTAVALGGPEIIDVSYTWTSSDGSFTSNESNPTVTTSSTTTYYLEVNNGVCPLTLQDSVTISIGTLHTPPVIEDTLICIGDVYILEAESEAGVTYTWIPTEGVGNPNSLNTSFAPTATTTYTLTLDEAGCQTSTSFTISLRDTIAPLLNVSHVDTSACLGSPLSFTAEVNIPGTITWTGGGSGNNYDMVVTGNDDIVVTFTPENTCFAPISKTIEVRALGSPTIPELTDQSICPNDSFLLTATPQFGVVYNWTPSIGVTDNGSLNATFRPTTPTTYQVIASVGQCTDTSSFSIDFLPTPTEIIFSSQGICAGESVTVNETAQPGVTYTWSPTEGVADPNSLNTTITPTVTTTYILTAELDGCTVSTELPIAIGDGDELVPHALPDTITVCIGDAFSIDPLAGLASTYEWSNGTTASTLDIDGLTESTTYTVTITPTSSPCFIATTDSVFVNVISEFGLPELTDQTICTGNSYELTGATALDNIVYTWNPVQGVADANSLNTSFNPATTTTYELIAMAGACSDTTSFTITVEDAPAAISFSPVTACIGEAITINESVNSDVNYTWSPAEGVADPNSLNTTITATETTIYTLTQEFAGCIQTSDLLINIERNPIPFTLSNNNFNVCTGSDISISVSSAIAANYTWSNGATGSAINLDAVSQNLDLVVTAVPLDTSCYFSAFQTIDIDVIENPVLPTLEDQGVCIGDSYQLIDATPEAGVSYTWSPATGVNDVNNLNATFNPTTTTTYTLVANTPENCTSETSFELSIGAEPTITMEDTINVCLNIDFDLTASADVAGTYTWTPGDLSGATATVVGGVSENTLYTLLFASDDGCTVEEQILAQVVSGVAITGVTASPTEGYVGDLITLAVETEPSTDITYNWSSGGTNATETVTLATIPEESYTVTVTDENGCFAQSGITIAVGESKYGLPNAFTPGRTTNQTFGLVTTGANIEVLSFRIWDRFGKLVHEGKGDNHAWDGRTNGKLVPSDAYLYGVEIRMPDGTTVFEKGDITVIR